jgi:hypothetical protein
MASLSAVKGACSSAGSVAMKGGSGSGVDGEEHDGIARDGGRDAVVGEEVQGEHCGAVGRVARDEARHEALVGEAGAVLELAGLIELPIREVRHERQERDRSVDADVLEPAR